MTALDVRRAAVFCVTAALLLSNAAAAEKRTGASDCNFLTNQDEFLNREARARGSVSRKFGTLGRMAARAAVDPSSIPHRNFVDSEILGKLRELNVPTAALSTDEEFLRRVTLDLTGRIPSVADIRAFTADTSAEKRAVLIDTLLNSPEFSDKWSWWMSDLLQVNASASNVSLNVNGRNAFYLWVKAKITEYTSLKDIAYQCVTATGNNYLMEQGASNYVVKSITPGGPTQDQYDAMFSKSASAFLGVGYYDCILCHNGRGHLEALSLWGKSATRIEAQRMAAFFARQNIANHPDSQNRDSFFAGARMITERATGDYALNTTNGNRPPRCAPGATIANNRCSATMNILPEYHVTGMQPGSGQNRREAFAANMVDDPMFARNFANRLWKEMFNLGLVDPVDSLDPARLDPNNPPADPWTLQATHPQLLEKLAAFLRTNNYSLREYLKLIANSSAYQLSASYGGEWKLDYVPLFARHYPRRLEGEEIHDAIVKATGVLPSYTVQGWSAPVSWAMQLPEPAEPRSNGTALNFMNAFLRGNRDTAQRSQQGSILQQLNLMNDATVLSRNKVAASPLLRALATNTNNQAVVEEIFLLFLGRKPQNAEQTQALGVLARATTQTLRNTAVEDLAWALINKIEFLYSY